VASVSDRQRLLYKIARAYYIDDLTQAKIAKRFGISRPNVSRLLKRAREEKIVQITLSPLVGGYADLEQELEARYGLDEAVVVPAADYDAAAQIVRDLGAAAADYLVRCLRGDEVLGLSWGTTLLATVDALPAKSWPDLQVVQILGGLGSPEAETHGTDLARRTASAFGARLHLLPAPGIVASKAVRDALLSDPQIYDTLALAACLDVALVGIGAPTPDSVVMRTGTILSQAELEQIKRQGAVGDIALRFFDENGQPIDTEMNDRIVGITLDELRRIERVIGVAGGRDKFEVIRGALRGKLITTLVTDNVTAQKLTQDST
jgi:DNA-binding transcriptional regulator LsrR (DeoR family)